MAAAEHDRRIPWRLGVRLLLVGLLAALVWMRIAPLHHTPRPAARPAANAHEPTDLNLPGGGLAPSDAYEVYSDLYREPVEGALAISGASLTDIPQVDGSCLRPKTSSEHAMTDAFVAANKLRRQWEQKFAIPRGYRLVTSAELPDLQTCLATHGREGANCGRYKDVRYVRLLGVPGFDQAHEHALVSVIKSCGSYCGTGGIFEVEKSAGHWQRMAADDFTRDCSWMY